MQFIAQRNLRAQGRDGNIVNYGPGDVIPDFMDWDIHARRAHLSWDIVVPCEDEQVVADARAVSAAPQPAQHHDAFAPVNCPHCPGKVFAGQRALKAHSIKTHKVASG